MPSVVRLLTAAIVATTLLMAGGASPAAAAQWSKTRIYYYDASGWTGPVKQGVRWINRMPGPVRFVRTRSRSRADVVVEQTYRPNVNWLGRTGVYTIGRRVVGAQVELNDALAPAGGQAAELLRDEVAAHELLHAVGLEHRRTTCSLMGTSGLPPFGYGCRNKARTGEMRCGPQRTDAKVLAGMYGGSLGKFRGFRCPVPRS